MAIVGWRCEPSFVSCWFNFVINLGNVQLLKSYLDFKVLASLIVLLLVKPEEALGIGGVAKCCAL